MTLRGSLSLSLEDPNCLCCTTSIIYCQLSLLYDLLQLIWKIALSPSLIKWPVILPILNLKLFQNGFLLHGNNMFSLIFNLVYVPYWPESQLRLLQDGLHQTLTALLSDLLDLLEQHPSLQLLQILNTTGSGALLVSSRQYSGQDVLCDPDSLYSGNRFSAQTVSLKTVIKTNTSWPFCKSEVKR